MKRQGFERIVRDSRLTPVHREERSNHLILIADGWLQDHPEQRGPHYKTVWGVGKNENEMRVGRALYFTGGVGSSTRADRLAAALKDAREMADGLNGRRL